MKRFAPPEIFFLVTITLFAAFFRFYQLDSIPPGFQFDQAFYVLDALKLLQGEFSIFFFQPGRSEPLYQYLLMLGVALFGADTSLGLKFTGAVIGTLTIPLIYFVARVIFQSTRVAQFAAFLAAISFWHIFYSRFGERIPLTVFMALLSFLFLWRALDRMRWKEFALAGFFSGVSLWTYPSGRIVPIAVVLLTAYAMLSDRANARVYFKGLILAGGIAAIVFLPLGIHYFLHPDDLFSHAAQVSIFSPHDDVTANLPAELAKNALRILGMFLVAGDGGALRNLPYRPIFDPFAGALFVVGVVVLLITLVSPRAAPIHRRRAIFLAVWLGLALTLSLVSDDAPNNGRVLIGMPVVMMLPAWGANEIGVRLTGTLARRVGVAALGVILAISTGWVYRDYFVTFANLPGLYYTFDVDKVEVSKWVNENNQAQKIFLAPLWYQQGTISLLTRNARLKSFDSRDTIVLPSRADNQDALFGFPPDQERRIQTLGERLGGLGMRDDLIGANDARLLLVYRVPTQNLPDPQNPLGVLSRGGAFIQPRTIARGAWGDQIELVAYTLTPEGPGGRNLTVTLFIHALAPMHDDYTFSVKVWDEKKRVWGQEDKWLGDNSYATTQTSAGDLVIEKFYPGLNACAPADDYRITVEAYNPKTNQVLALTDRQGSRVALGGLRAGASEGNLYEHLEPNQVKELRVNDRLQMLGYSLLADTVRAGESFSLSLFWRGVGAGSAEKISVKLGDETLTDATIQIPAEGRGICAFYDLTVPGSVAGNLPLRVNDRTILQIQVNK